MFLVQNSLLWEHLFQTKENKKVLFSNKTKTNSAGKIFKLNGKNNKTHGRLKVYYDLIVPIKKKH